MSSEQRSNLDELATRTVAMPADTNPSGDIFGGWVLSEMNIAGSIVASKRTKGRIATVGLEAMSFHKPIKVGDIVSNYARVVRVGRISITVEVITAVERQLSSETIVVTEGLFTYVAVNEKGQPRLIERL